MEVACVNLRQNKQSSESKALAVLSYALELQQASTSLLLWPSRLFDRLVLINRGWSLSVAKTEPRPWKEQPLATYSYGWELQQGPTSLPLWPSIRSPYVTHRGRSSSAAKTEQESGETSSLRFCHAHWTYDRLRHLRYSTLFDIFLNV